MSRDTTVLDYLYSPETLTNEAVFAEILHLRRYGTPARDIPARIGISRYRIEQAARRANRTDIIAAISQKETLE